jgi:hypothetical protein
MNLAQAYTYAQLICKDTPLEPAIVAGMHILGLLHLPKTSLRPP